MSVSPSQFLLAAEQRCATAEADADKGKPTLLGRHCESGFAKGDAISTRQASSGTWILLTAGSIRS